MLEPGWLTVKQAQAALNNGRLEEAAALLRQPEAQGHKRSWDLLTRLAGQFIARGELALRNEDSEAAWADLLLAEQLGKTPAGTRLRQNLTKLVLAEVRSHLIGGDPSRAALVLDRVRSRSLHHADLDRLEELVRLWNRAIEHADRGQFPEAVTTTERLLSLDPSPPTQLKRFAATLRDRQQLFNGLLGDWRAALAANDGRDLLPLCDRVLAQAPNYAEAKAERARAWQALNQPISLPPSPLAVTVAAEEVGPGPKERSTDEGHALPQSYLLWVDGVGGYLVLLKNRIAIGQATPDNCVELALFADISRLHAYLRREAEGYLLEAVRRVQVNDEPFDKGFLRNGDRLRLGGGCQLKFEQPAAVSASARLDLISGQRLPLAVDAVLLMAETLIFGPGPQSHVQVPDLRQPLVVHRHKDGLAVRYSGSFALNGTACQERGVLGTTATLRADGCTFAVEPVTGPWVGPRSRSLGVSAAEQTV